MGVGQRWGMVRARVRDGLGQGGVIICYEVPSPKAINI